MVTTTTKSVAADIVACGQLRADWEYTVDDVQSAAIFDPSGKDPAAEALEHLLSLHTEDSVLALMVNNGPYIYNGQDAIRGYFRANRTPPHRFVHTLSYPLIRVDGDTAKALWYVTMFVGGDEPPGIAECRDTYVRVGGEWKIKQITAYPRITGGGGPVAPLKWAAGKWPADAREWPAGARDLAGG